jgi:hypothetical protein
MIGLSAGRLYSNLLAVSTNPKSDPPPTDMFTMCFLDGWSIVDNLWRLNLLLRRTPGLKRTPEVEAHLRALRVVEDFSHGFQHLDAKIAACAQDQLPLWGTLGWVFFPHGPTKSGKIFLMVPGSLRPGTWPFLNPAGKPIADTLDLVTLTAFGHELQLSSLVRRVRTLISGLDQGLRISTADQPGGGADAFISAEFVPGIAEEPDKRI